VIVIDANLLIYAYDRKSAFHARSRAWLQDMFAGATPVWLPWLSVTAFLRVLTNPRVPVQQRTLEQNLEIVDRWFEQPNVRLLSPGDGHWPILREMILRGQTRGPMVTDAQLAALTIECGGVLHTADRGFARFPGLRWTNPLT